MADAPTRGRRTRTAPRHAAPRKPLLTRLHLPAGKAVAMVAMPSAVLMGMGLTPQLANAKPLPKNPFKDGPCVSAPDQEADAEKKAAKEKAAKEKAAKEKAAKEKAAKAEAAREKAAKEKAAREKAAKEPGAGEGDEAAPSEQGTPDSPGSDGSPSGGGTDGSDAGRTEREPDPEPDPSEPEPEPDPEPEPEPGKKNPLDPLGLGEKLKDALTPKKKREAEKEAEEAAPESEKSVGKSPTEAVEETVDKAEEGVGDTVDKAEKGVEDTVEGLRDVTGSQGGEDAQDGGGGEEPEEQRPGASGTSGVEKDDPDAEDEGAAGEASEPEEDGKKPFPCVEEKKVDGDDERTPVTLPNQPWYLEASSLALHDLDYEGVVNVTMANGKTKQALKFTSSGLDIGDLHQIVAGPQGTTYHVEAAKGTTSTIRDGRVTMYTERLEGNLFGLIPIVFDPEHPPPVNVSEAYFTKVKVTQAGQFGGTLTIPGLHQSIT
ncbi:hypothetical protein LHJ74_21605 [Streptomyces sp. N2-109]|uniref:Hydrogenase expression protein HypF n=1 Tax=Streptomyces gossypii TaxID=2883101 RepID=A0ABT2JX99_9ACTN|nr:hypothetical protein [Streptomyces gossypii]MCT2592471.1 hypothetical protein [Streptomyces gossypii]